MYIGFIINGEIEHRKLALEKEKITTSMIQHLSDRKEDTRQDIALVVLDAITEKENKAKLVVPIAKVIYRWRADNGKDDDVERGVAGEILKLYAPEIAEQLDAQRLKPAHKVLAEYTPPSAKESVPVSSPTPLTGSPLKNGNTPLPSTSSKPDKVLPKEIEKNLELAVNTHGRLIFIHISQELENIGKALRNKISSEDGVFAPGIETFSPDMKLNNTVRYFNREDEDVATKIRDVVNEFMEKNGQPKSNIIYKQDVRYLGERYPAPLGVIEIWYTPNPDRDM